MKINKPAFDHSRGRVLGVILCVFVLVASGCSPTVDTPPIVSTLPALPSITPSGPDVVLQTPTTSAGLLPTPGSDFCTDDQVQAVLTGLVDAIINSNGAALASLVDPVEGMDIYYTVANPPVHISSDHISGLFDSPSIYFWGVHPGSGLPVEGTFGDEIYPSLLDVMNRTYVQACQSLERGVGTGPTTASVVWPDKYQGMPYVALYRAAGQQDNELDWRTWAVGFSVIDGVPKIRVLVQYFWEI